MVRSVMDLRAFQHPLDLVAREGFVAAEHLKRYTTTGMATDQGKTSNVNALGMLSGITGRSIPETGTTTFRPPYTPVSFGLLAGQRAREVLAKACSLELHPLTFRLGHCAQSTFARTQAIVALEAGWRRRHRGGVVCCKQSCFMNNPG